MLVQLQKENEELKQWKETAENKMKQLEEENKARLEEINSLLKDDRNRSEDFRKLEELNGTVLSQSNILSFELQ